MKRLFIYQAGQINERQFLAKFAGVYESSPWIARELWQKTDGHPPADVDNLAMALAEVVDTASQDQQLDLIRAHPDLAGRAAIAGQLTRESRSEQTSAGLDQCTPTELAQFRKLNRQYRTKFGFPFIMAVKGADRHEILAGFAERINNDGATEVARAIAEIHKIAMLRLKEIASNG